LVNWAPLPDGRHSCELRFVADLDPETTMSYRVLATGRSTASTQAITSLKNEWLEVVFSDQTGILSFKYNGSEIGGTEFLQPFISYRTKKMPVV
jgi:hypothetical protein